MVLERDTTASKKRAMEEGDRLQGALRPFGGEQRNWLKEVCNCRLREEARPQTVVDARASTLADNNRRREEITCF